LSVRGSACPHTDEIWLLCSKRCGCG
jgi:hypothetical protein